MNNKKTKKPVRSGRYKYKFKSRLEEKVWEKLPKKRSEYEPTKLDYDLHKSYTPDFVVTRTDGSKLFIEAKGYLRPTDRTKMIAVKEKHPDLDIRIVFGSDNKLNKNSQTRYSDWCKRNGFPYAIMNVPYHWIYPDKRSKEELLEYQSTYYQRNKKKILDRMRDQTMQKMYGINVQEFERMKEEQNHKCAICEVDFKSLARQPDIDHCHEHGHVRGLLCWTCNGGLGQYNDDPELMRKAADYLEKNKK